MKLFILIIIQISYKILVYVMYKKGKKNDSSVIKNFSLLYDEFEGCPGLVDYVMI